MGALAELVPSLTGLIVLLGLSAFFSGSETALFALSRSQVRRFSTGSRAQRAVDRLLQEPQRLLSTILVGNMVVNIMLASVIASLMGRALSGRGLAGTLIAICVSTILLMIFGELTPKTIAYHHPQRLSAAAALPLLLFGRLITPVRSLLRWVTWVLLAALGQRNVPGWSMMTHEEIAAVLAAGEAAGATDKHEIELVQHILRLSSVRAHEIMVPRTDVKAVDDELTVGQAFRKACRLRHSRLPIYHGSPDDIWGVLAVIDLPRWRGTPMMDCPLSDLRAKLEDPAYSEPIPVYPVYVAPEAANLEQLLGDMRAQNAQFAVIVGEYGGTAGILTLDDILEEVVEGIAPTEYSSGRVADVDGTVFADGRTLVRELNEDMGLGLTQNGSDTIGGYIMDRLGRMPRADDHVRDDGYCLRVIKMAGRRIGAVRITPLPTDEEDDT